jgi:heterodisulfide reductase subunit A
MLLGKDKIEQMTDRRIGVFICYCGGNISDVVDVEKVRNVAENEPGVVVARTHTFCCADADQQEIIESIHSEKLDGLVIASCSPKLHLLTFRSVAERAGLNPYQYVQVNLREQCSWTHTDAPEEATEKAVRLVRGGIAKASLTRPLETLRIETVPKALVVGAGVAGLRAALSLADMGLHVFLMESASEVGGWVGSFGRMYPHDKPGTDLIAGLRKGVKARENITLFTNAELIEKSGSVGNFSVKIQVKEKETIHLTIGAIVVATGFDLYKPAEGEFGYGQEGVFTLGEFRELLDRTDGKLSLNGRPIRNIVYIYCVGSRQNQGEAQPNLYCSRYCCTSAVHTALCAHDRDGELNQYHLFRDMRTYGKYEILYETAGKKGSIFVKYPDDAPPAVEEVGGKLCVRVNDVLADGEEIEIQPDLVVLVTGMVPRNNRKLVNVLKLPIGQDGFFNEIHPKLKPVETVIAGVFIAGAAQGPKTMAESVISSLAAAAKSAALVMKGYVDLEPLIAKIDIERCVWCEACVEACPYDAIEKIAIEGKEVASVVGSLCKGGGPCVPVCPKNAIDIEGYTDTQVKAMITALMNEVP